MLTAAARFARASRLVSTRGAAWGAGAAAAAVLAASTTEEEAEVEYYTSTRFSKRMQPADGAAEQRLLAFSVRCMLGELWGGVRAALRGC